MNLGIKYQGKILRLMTLSWKDPHFLVPHMQTALLKKLQQYPTAWTDLPIVEKELALRVVNYLVATAKPVGLILNFGERKIEVKRKNKDLKMAMFALSVEFLKVSVFSIGYQYSKILLKVIHINCSKDLIIFFHT